MCAKGTLGERGASEPVLGTAEDYKIDMHVVRAQNNDHPSFASGEFAIGDDIMAVRAPPFPTPPIASISFWRMPLRNTGAPPRNFIPPPTLDTTPLLRVLVIRAALIRRGCAVAQGMCLVKMEDGVAMLDCPKKRKPMETAQVRFNP